jgi:predicted dienelactone hydrolase
MVALSALLLALGTAPVENSFHAGIAFRSFTPKEPYDWRGAKTHALQATVWYPAPPAAVEEPLSIPGMSGFFVLPNAARDAAFATSPRRFPLVVLSHGTGGTALSVAWLGAALARRGYIVAGVNHPGNNAVDGYTVEGFSVWWERARDLREVIDAVLRDAAFSDHVDEARIGAAGFSLGGYTMIEVAGGTTDLDAFQAFCASKAADDICKSPPEFPALLADFEKLRADHPERLRRAGDSYRDPRIRAVFAMAPALGPAFTPKALSRISIPVAIVAGDADKNVPIASGARYFAANIARAKLETLAGVGHYAFLDTCTASAREARPMICADAAGVDRDAVHARTAAMAATFFAAALK